MRCRGLSIPLGSWRDPWTISERKVPFSSIRLITPAPSKSFGCIGTRGRGGRSKVDTVSSVSLHDPKVSALDNGRCPTPFLGDDTLRACPRTTSARAWPSATTSRARTCSSRLSSTRSSTSSPSWPATGRARARHRHGPDRAAARAARCPRARDRPLGGDGRAAAGEAGRGGDRRDDRRLRDDDRRRHVLARLPRLQHDHEPDDAGRAGRLLPRTWPRTSSRAGAS